MSQNDPRDRERKEQAAMVNRLLKKLHYPEPSPSHTSSATTPRPSTGVPRQGGYAARPEPTGLGTWARVGLGLLLAIALPLWPYGHACGFGLFAYLAGIVTLLVAGGWAALTSWERRVAAAHFLSLLLLGWGLMLAAGQILPRVGYAKQAAYWRCSTRAAATAQAAGAGDTSQPCAFQADLQVPPDLIVRAYACDGSGMMRLEKRTAGEANAASAWELKNVIIVPPLAANEQFVLGLCRLDGTVDPGVVAVARVRNVPRLRDIRVAFRVDAQRERFEPIPADRVTCDNTSYGV